MQFAPEACKPPRQRRSRPNARERKRVMCNDDKEKKEEIKAPIEEICANSEDLAAELVNDDSEIEPTSGFFFTSQRWH